MKLKFVLTLLLLAFALPIFAQTEVPDGTPSSIVAILTPLIVLGATAIARLITPKISGTMTLIVVTILSGAQTWVVDYLEMSQGGWLIQFVLGLSAVFINQLYRQLTQNKNA